MLAAAPYEGFFNDVMPPVLAPICLLISAELLGVLTWCVAILLVLLERLVTPKLSMILPWLGRVAAFYCFMLMVDMCLFFLMILFSRWPMPLFGTTVGLVSKSLPLTWLELLLLFLEP